MSKIERVVADIGIEHILATENLDHYYDPSLYVDHHLKAGQERAPLQNLPTYPVVLRSALYGDAERQTYIPVGDHKQRYSDTRMGTLVARSRLVSDLYVIEHFPQPAETPLPTRINTTFFGNELYQPIQGFLLLKPEDFFRRDFMLLVGESMDAVRAQRTGPFRSRSYMNKVLHSRVLKAQRIHKNSQVSPNSTTL